MWLGELIHELATIVGYIVIIYGGFWLARQWYRSREDEIWSQASRDALHNWMEVDIEGYRKWRSEIDWRTIRGESVIEESGVALLAHHQSLRYADWLLKQPVKTQKVVSKFLPRCRIAPVERRMPEDRFHTD